MVDEQSPDGRLKTIGFVVSTAWIVVSLVYMYAVWPRVLKLEPDEFATFVGSIFAPLAFLWLVLGYFQQGEELRHSVEALKLQGRELANSVEQQRELVMATRDQIDHERAVAAAQEEAAARAAAPVIRVLQTSTVTNEGGVFRRYEVRNFGKPVRNLQVDVEPALIQRNLPILDDKDFVTFELVSSQRSQSPPKQQEVTVTYLDERNVRGEQRFSILIGPIPGFGLTYLDAIDADLARMLA